MSNVWKKLPFWVHQQVDEGTSPQVQVGFWLKRPHFTYCKEQRAEDILMLCRGLLGVAVDSRQYLCSILYACQQLFVSGCPRESNEKE